MRPSRGRLVLAACAAVVLLGLGFRLGGYALLDPDEGRNAEVAREMAASNDYLLPHLNGLPYIDKPVLYFAAGALSMELFGPTVFAARLPSLLFTLGTLAIVWWFGRRLFGGEAGVVAALATAASPLTLAFSRTVIMDSAVTLFVVGALVAFYVAIERTVRRLDGETPTEETLRRSDAQTLAPQSTKGGASDPGASSVRASERPSVRVGEGGGAGWWPALAWGSLALGVLTKGPIALALPLMVVVPYAWWRKAGRVFLDPVGPLLFLALVLPWVRLVSQRVPDYLNYVVVTETFQRLTTPALQRTGPWWYFIPILLAGALPWSVIALGAVRRGAGTPDRRMVFLALWVLVPLVFFSLSQSKRPQYVLPLVPAIALVIAAHWSERAAKIGAITLATVGIVLLTAFSQVPRFIRSVTPEIAGTIPATALALGVVALTAAVVAWRFGPAREVALLALCLPVAVIPFVSGKLMTEVARTRSAEPLSRAILPVMIDATEIVGVHAFPPSLPFYLRRTTTIATDSARELTSNYLVRTIGFWAEVPGSPLRTGNWWQEAAIQCDRPRIFVVRATDTEAWQFVAARLPILAATAKYAAFGPCGQASLALKEPSVEVRGAGFGGPTHPVPRTSHLGPS